MQYYQSHMPLSQRTDPPRNEEMVRVQIEIMRPGIHGVAGHAISGAPGEVVEVLVYRSDLKQIEEKTETEFGVLAQATANYKRLLREHIAKATGDSIQDVSDNPSDWTPEQKKAEGRFGNSPEAEFNRAMGRGIRPFKSHKVVEEGVAPPVNPYDPMSMMARNSMSSAGSNSEIEDLRAELARLKRELGVSDSKRTK